MKTNDHMYVCRYYFDWVCPLSEYFLFTHVTKRRTDDAAIVREEISNVLTWPLAFYVDT